MPLDPCFEALLADRRIHLRRPRPPVTLQDLREGGNAFMRAAIGPGLPQVGPLTFVSHDSRRIPGRAYRAAADAQLPAIVFFHGGGFVFGDLDTHDAMCRLLAASSGTTVLAVDYRLAPEHPFPAALHDCQDALLHVARAPESFGVRAGPIAIAGDSAGAQLAIATALSTVDARLRLAHAALLYPVVDPRCSSGSMHELERGYMLTREAMEWFWECYLQRAEDRADPRADVLAADLSRFPPTTIVTAELDPLRDEGHELARRLEAAGVHVDRECRPGMIHGFAGMPQLTPVAAEVLARVGRRMGRALGLDVPLGAA